MGPHERHPDARPNRRFTTRRAFTLLEIVLATLLGAMVLVTATAVFMSIARSDARNEDAMERSMELSLAHQSIEKCLRTVIFSNQAPPVPLPGAPGRTPGSPDLLNTAQQPTPSTPNDQQGPPDFDRLVLSRSTSTGMTMRWTDANGRIQTMAPQRLSLAVERPPVFAEPEPGEVYVPVTHRMYASRRSHHSRSDANRSTHRGSDQSRDAQAPADPLPGTDPEEPAIAPGVRGEFVLTFDPPNPRDRSAFTQLDNGQKGSWTLWWRTVPPLAGPTDGSGAAEGLTDQDLENDPMYRPVKLVTHLEYARWEAVRSGETTEEYAGRFWIDMPAYVTLELKTTNGKWMKWMFEPQGGYGPEPGTEIEPPSQPGVGGVAGETELDPQNPGNPQSGGKGTGSKVLTPPTRPTNSKTSGGSNASQQRPTRPPPRPSAGGNK